MVVDRCHRPFYNRTNREHLDDVMDGQLDFFGGGSDGGLKTAESPRDRYVHRCYFTIVPPPLEAQRIERGAGLLAHRFGARHQTRAERLHVSLNGVWRSRDAIEPAPGSVCTGPVQTYLDLAAAGERGREAADHLRQEKLAWHR